MKELFILKTHYYTNARSDSMKLWIKQKHALDGRADVKDGYTKARSKVARSLDVMSQ